MCPKQVLRWHVFLVNLIKDRLLCFRRCTRVTQISEWVKGFQMDTNKQSLNIQTFTEEPSDQSGDQNEVFAEITQ